MNRSPIYDKLHKELAKEFNTTSSIINYIRSLIIGDKKTLQEMISQCLHKKKVTTVNKQKWTERLNFLLSINIDTLNKITKVK